jgi:hypothetical protein
VLYQQHHDLLLFLHLHQLQRRNLAVLKMR